MELIRSFIAIELPAEVKAAIAAARQSLRRHSSIVRWVKPESTHLTLKFLAWVPADLVQGIVKTMNEATSNVKPFQLSVGGLGAFPTFASPRVIWIGVKGEIQPLASIEQRLQELLLPLGFEKDNRPFTPHLTLGRVEREASPSDRRDLGQRVQVLASLKTDMTTSFTVTGLTLMRSTLHSTGAVYTRTAVVPFIVAARGTPEREI